MKRNIKRRGFTLVELLIVIVVIGILSAMMMLSSTEAVTSAKASNIVSDMRNLKTAALSYYVDNLDKFSSGDATVTEAIALSDVTKYLNNSNALTDSLGFSIEKLSSGDWYVKYDTTKAGSNSEQGQIREKLAGRAKSVGLLQNSSGTMSTYAKTATDVYYFIR